MNAGITSAALPGRNARPRATGPHDGYLALLCGLLLGYAFLGKGFAYIGVPPLFVGEIALALGCLVLWRSGCLFALTASLPLVLLAALIAWVAARTIPYLGIYGIDAPRDGMVVFYGLYAFIAAGLLIERTSRLAWTIALYRRMAYVYGFVGGALFLGTANLPLLFPGLDATVLPSIRPGEAAVHLGGAAVFAIVGLMRVRWYWILAWVAGATLISPSRGATLSVLVPVCVAFVASGKAGRALPALLAAAGLFLLSYVAKVEVPLPGDRQISAEQIMDRMGSIVGRSANDGLDGTKQWRLRWWGTIRGYTLEGPLFWSGKGFGVNLAVDDDFVVGERSVPTLRSPHNAHLTILARSGVPGLGLWIAMLTAWFAALAGGFLAARRRGQDDWAGLFVWVGCYALGALINASFDVALEGPMQGIWFWCLFGLGAGMVMIHRAQTDRTAPGPRGTLRWSAAAPVRIRGPAR